jgi:hypothetical protein
MTIRTIAVGVAGVLLLTATIARAQSLADVARKEEDRRKTVNAPAKVYTNDDLKKYPQTTPPPGEAAAPAPEATGKPAAAAPDAQAPADQQSPPKDEAYWKQRVTEAQAQLERHQEYLLAVQSRINALTAEFYARDDPAQRGQLWSDRTKVLNELESLKKQVADDTKAIADIQEEARRAGVPPGWLR